MQHKVLLIMNKETYLKDISEIKNLMNRSSKFMSLNGLSGILAGIYGLIGAYLAFILIDSNKVLVSRYAHGQVNTLLIKLLALASIIVLLSVGTAIFLSYKKAKKNGENIWNPAAKNMLIQFLIPLLTGGIFALLLLTRQYYGLISSVTLIFYGLALVNAAKYTVGTIYYLGLSEIILGLIATAFPGYGIWFWALGFGIFHIIYGSIMYYKFDRQGS